MTNVFCNRYDEIVPAINVGAQAGTDFEYRFNRLLHIMSL